MLIRPASMWQAGAGAGAPPVFVASPNTHMQTRFQPNRFSKSFLFLLSLGLANQLKDKLQWP